MSRVGGRRRAELVTTALGRRLAYLDVGDHRGTPVLYFHGTPGAPCEIDLFEGERLAEDLGVRLIAPARPGLWRSDFQSGRRIFDWPADVAALLDHLGIHRAAVVGYSGGGPYALAVAAVLPHRVTTACVVANADHRDPSLADGLDPGAARMRHLAARHPIVARAGLHLAMAWPARHRPDDVLRQLRRTLPEPDRRVLDDPAASSAFVRMLHDAFTGGTRGPQQDLALIGQGWGFDPAAITVPLSIWQGSADTLGATTVMARRLRDEVPDAQLNLLPEGHLSILTNHIGTILSSARNP